MRKRAPGVAHVDQVGEQALDRGDVHDLGGLGRLGIGARAGIGVRGEAALELGHAGELGPEPVQPGLGIGVVGAERVGHGHVQSPRHLAERERLGAEVAAGLFGGHAGAEQVAQRGVGQVPGVGGPEEVLPHDRQVGPVGAQLGQLRHDVREAPFTEDLGDLDVGVGLGVHPAEQLEDEPLVVDDGRVRLLDDEGPGDGRRLVGRHLLEHGQGQVGVDEGVVVEPAVDLTDGDALLAEQEVVVAPGRPAAEDDLVRGRAAVGVDDIEQEPRQHGVAVARGRGSSAPPRSGVRGLHTTAAGEGTAPAAEPASRPSRRGVARHLPSTVRTSPVRS